MRVDVDDVDHHHTLEKLLPRLESPSYRNAGQRLGEGGTTWA
jgi:hypothetical protein